MIIVKPTNENIQDTIEEALRSCLCDIPTMNIVNIKREPLLGTARPDLVAKVSSSEGEMQLIVEMKTNGQPRFTREAINQLARYKATLPNSYGIVAAPYISPQAANICKDEKVGYLDLAGNCRLAFGTVYVERKGNPNPFTEKRELRSLYSPKASRILRVFLNNPKKAWRTAALATEANISLGHVSNVRKLLLDREWLRDESDGFRLIQPQQALEEWSNNYTFRKNKLRRFYSMKKLGDLERDLGMSCARLGFKYAFTGFSAAARLLHPVRYSAAMIYIQDYDQEFLESLSLKEVESGPNVNILSPYDEGVFYDMKDIQGVKIVSPIQIYLDLKGIRGRGEEAAETLLNEEISQRW